MDKLLHKRFITQLKARAEYNKYTALCLEDISKAEKDYITALEDMEMKLLGEDNKK